MTDLIDDQRLIAQRISRVLTNLKKKGKPNITVELLQENLETAKRLWDEFHKGDHNVRAAARKDAKLLESRYFKEDEYDQVQGSYHDLAAALRRWIADHEAVATVKDSKNSNETVAATNAQRSRAVLPKMALPTFEGNYKDWPAFRDLFTSLIVNDLSLSPVERLHYLKSCMKGGAASLMKNVQTTSENFTVAWEKLENRYSNQRLLVQAQIKSLTSLAPVRKESASEMKRLFDETFDANDALDNLGRPVTNAVDWIVELTVERLDLQSRREWEESLQHSKELPTLDELKTFMEGRIHTCEALESSQHDESSFAKKPVPKTVKVHQVSKASSQIRTCSICQEKHFILFCGKYREKTPVERKETVRSLGLCFNCLGKHSASDCKSSTRCQRCDGKHHTSIHEASPNSKENPAAGVCVQHSSTHVSLSASVLLSTARVRVSGSREQNYLARSLIDPGSEVSLITETLAQRLGVKRRQARVPLLGVGGTKARFTKGKTTLVLSPHYGRKEKIEVPVYIISELSKYKPRNLPSVDAWPHVQGLPLADPSYHLPDPVDILLGADSYNIIMLEGVKRGPPDTPVAQETILGWILTGGVKSESGDEDLNKREIPIHHCSIDRELMDFLTRFWEQEEIETSIPRTADEQRAEEHFVQTHLRLPEGRYMVRLPFHCTPELGDSRSIALRTLESLNRRFQRSTEFQRAYSEFLETYESLGHMAAAQHPKFGEGYILPHHGVWKDSSSTTKLRVVFNGSMPSSNGKSLNDYLLRGPNLLPNLADVLLRWRRHMFVFSADIEKMYRQILVHPEDRKWQRILWRPKQEGSIVDYDLKTVTYGLACAPYLAMRTLHQLAKDEELQFPLGSQVVLQDVYMDDVLTGGDTLQEARLKQQELRRLLMAGGFPLRKWASNSKGLLDGLSNEERKGIVEWDSPTLHNVLGIKWIPSSDCFQVTAVPSLKSSGFTKRSVLSGTAQLFDPLGWLAPVTIAAKVLIQSLWLLKNLQVPRWLGTCSSKQPLELHGFADASERAYAAVVYFRTTNAEGVTTVSLIVAKSKVAPLKRVSLPRLELCAAFLLARLIEHVIRILNWQDVDLHLWSDSSVTLNWIKGHPSRWPTYVANRVAEIQRILPFATWHHVRSAENPADCASRGLSPAELSKFTLWWRGPEWLSSPGQIPSSPYEEVGHETEALEVHHVTSQEKSTVHELITQFSNLSHLVRVLAWCRRWIPGNRKGDAFVTAAEMQETKLTLLRLEQATAFSDDISHLRENQPVATKSKLAKLYPLLDQNGVLRVGGRLQAANLPYDRMHPAILPENSPLAKLWVDAAHKRCLHGGHNLPWQHCARNAGSSEVVNWSGVDYAGPILLRAGRGRGRGQLTSKGYIAVFVCLSTKAVHLEAVSDGSTETFLAALRRFISRRGRCAELYSDCGRNFVGANHELRALLKQSLRQGGGAFATVSKEGIVWNFNPPSAPHFGGIWEAAVKSVKHHLRRLIGEQRLSFEELTTLLAGIEACLNSRPLQPLSDDPEDPAALTPGHFLIGGPIISLPEPSFEVIPLSRLSRWQLIQQLQQHFWKRWSREYLNTLQTRGKWRKNKIQIKTGFLCLIKSEETPPTQWPLARVVQVHPGPDGNIRVVTVRTSTSQFLRPVHKLIPLIAPEEGEGDKTKLTRLDLPVNSPINCK